MRSRKWWRQDPRKWSSTSSSAVLASSPIGGIDERTSARPDAPGVPRRPAPDGSRADAQVRAARAAQVYARRTGLVRPREQVGGRDDRGAGVLEAGERRPLGRAAGQPPRVLELA